MASIISAGTTDATSLNVSSDKTGILQLASNNAVTAVTIDTSQRVGIGTTSPSTKLHINNASTSATYLRAENNNGYALFGVDASGYAYAGAESNSPFGLVTNGTYRLYIDTSGNVGIGTTSPASKLEISDTSANGLRISGAGDHALGFTGYSGNAATQVFSIRNDGINNCYINTQNSVPLNFGVSTGTSFGSTTSQMKIISTGQIGVNVSPAAGNTFRVVNIGSDNAVQFGNASNGVYLANGGTSFSAYSDTRLKNITGRYETPLANIAKIDVIKFTWKNDTENKPQVGVSAQSVETVIPEAIDRGTNFNAEGDTTEYLSVRYTELIPLMISSIQELKAINDTQAETINALTARIEALENK